MRAVIRKSRASGKLDAPPSKTLAHRELIAAALADGESHIQGLCPSEDILATLDCIRALGAEVTKEGRDPFDVTIRPDAVQESAVFPCRESGSTLRFFLPLCLRRDTECVLTGSERLLSRPLGVYEDICREQGLYYESKSDGLHVKGPLKPGEFSVRGDVSSQFITGLLFALPTLPGDSILRITPPIVSRPYIDITTDVLKQFGVEIVWADENTLRIPGNQRYKAQNLRVEGDYSNAAFPDGFNLIGGRVEVGNLNPTSLQGDRAYLEFYRQLKEASPVLDVSDTPDLAPVLMVLGAANHGVTLKGTSRLKIKESDRSEAMAEELRKLGVHALVLEDEITVRPSALQTPIDPISSHNDHRIAMAMSLLLSLTGGEIEGAEAVNKSWPGYFEAIKKLGIEVKTYGDPER